MRYIIIIERVIKLLILLLVFVLGMIFQAVKTGREMEQDRAAIYAENQHIVTPNLQFKEAKPEPIHKRIQKKEPYVH